MTEKQKRLIEGADRNVLSALEMANDMLTLNLLLAENVHDFFEPVDLGRLAESVLETYQAVAAEKGLDLATEVGPLPTIRGHREGLGFILAELLDNAIKYTPKMGNVRLTLAHQSAENVLRGEITDTGIGVPQEEREKIFTEFYRAPNAKQMVDTGTGLGLTIIRRALKVHRGTLTLQSTEGGPTSFAFTVPARPIPHQDTREPG